MLSRWAVFLSSLVGLTFEGCSSRDTSCHVAGTSSGTGGSSASAAGESVLQHHNSPTRNGVYTEATLTHQAAASMHLDPSFNATTQGATYAQPLFVDGHGTSPDLLVVATEEDMVYALDASSGAEVWSKSLGAAVKVSDLPCGNINPLGITGTPVIDFASHALYLDAMTTADGGTTKKHLIFGLSLIDGSVLPGFPIDVNAVARFGNLGFDSTIQNQRGALLILNGILYVPYGGHFGDCGKYHGWVVGVPLADPASVKAWATKAQGGGAWAPGGVSSDGHSIFVATGNTFGANEWSGGEAIIRLDEGPVFKEASTNYFSPTDWKALDADDVDIGGTAPVLLDLACGSPTQVAVSLGKNGKAYILDRTNLGGVSDAPASSHVSSNEIINAAAAYSTPKGTFVVFNGPGEDCPNQSGDLVAMRITAGSPATLATAWCANEHGSGSPMVTTTDGHSGAIVWTLGVEGDSKLHGYDGDTGAEIFAGGNATISGLKHFETPIAAKGRIFVAGTSTVVAFTSM